MLKKEISRQTAHRFILAHQHLYPPRQLEGKAGVLAFIRHVNAIQFDPINLVGRNPDLVLQARVKDYRPQMLDELLYEDRQLVDGWDKMASIYPAEDRHYFARHRAWMQARYGANETVTQVAPHILAEIDKRGALCSLDFKDNAKTDWAWGPTKVSRAGLEGLYEMGQLGVHHRVNNRRYFDRIENLLPADLLSAPDPNETDPAYQEWHILRRMASLGLAQLNAGEHWLGILGVKSVERKKIINSLVQRGEVISVAIDELPNEVFYLRACDLDLLDSAKESAQPEAAFLPPLDNLLWNRKKNGKLFNFEYIWEVYKPKIKRQYGYYILPVIYGDKFIARFDPAYDKKTGHFTLQNWWWEKDVLPDPQMEKALKRAMEDFLRYLGASRFSLGELLIDDSSLRWASQI